MKKIFFTAALGLFVFSCDKTNNTENHTDNHQSDNSISNTNDHGTTSNNNQRNEILREMDEMMADMHTQKLSGNIDEDYAEMMSEHHDGAIDMSEILLRKGSNQELKGFAEKVISAQKKEMATMDKFDDLKEKSSNHAEFEKDLKASMSAMMDKNIEIHNDIDKDYAQQMIPHHQSAVDMAKVYLKYGKQKDLLKLSNEVIATQTTEIAFLKDWLNRN